ncbi:MAG TPA: hypothetical protein PK771_09820 [Spirochaetota bacterium]|nr:hypothetical protein [Spirochaetota bacterium]
MKRLLFIILSLFLIFSCDLGKTDGSDFYSGYYVKDKDNDPSTKDSLYGKEEIGFNDEKKGYYISDKSNVMYSAVFFNWDIEKGDFYNTLKLKDFSFDAYENSKITPEQEIYFEYYFTDDKENLYLKEKKSGDGFMLYKKTSSPRIIWK